MQYAAIFGKGEWIDLVKGYKVIINNRNNPLPNVQHF